MQLSKYVYISNVIYLLCMLYGQHYEINKLLILLINSVNYLLLTIGHFRFIKQSGHINNHSAIQVTSLPMIVNTP